MMESKKNSNNINANGAKTQDIPNSKIRVAVLGASGYSGTELLALLHNNAYFELVAAYASARSEAQLFQSIAPALAGQSQLVIQPWQDGEIDRLSGLDAVFLALPHETSAELAPKFLARGIKVFDLSGAFRFSCPEAFSKAYGFEHPHPELLSQAQYTLMEWVTLDPNNMLFAVPGCYPTAASLALIPLCEKNLLASACRPIITAISGVSGAGRGANLRTSFCEVSTQAYGVLNHRHTPEIANNLKRDVVFTPVLGSFKRGILATSVVELEKGVTAAEVRSVYEAAYASSPLVHLRDTPVAVDHVAHTPMCLINLYIKDQTVVVVSAIDNLLKGAAAQAMQAANLVFGKPEMAGLGSS